MKLLRADADFSAETEFVAVRESRRGVHVDGGRIDRAKEALTVRFASGHDRV